MNADQEKQGPGARSDVSTSTEVKLFKKGKHFAVECRIRFLSPFCVFDDL